MRQAVIMVGGVVAAALLLFAVCRARTELEFSDGERTATCRNSHARAGSAKPTRASWR